MVDVVVQVVVLMFDDGLLDDGRRIAETLMLAVAMMVAGADNTQRRAGSASTVVAGVARSDRGEAVWINA